MPPKREALFIQHIQRFQRAKGEMAGSALSTVSKRLSVLRNAGLAEMDKRGSQVFYSQTTPRILKLVDGVDTVARSNAEKQIERVK